MLRKCSLFFLVAVIAMTGAGNSCRAADDAKLDPSIRFFGRWDLRAGDRAITVNTGSYLLARFSGDSIQARFDLALNKAPLPTLAWRIDDGAWQESEIAGTLKLAEGLSDKPHTLWLMVRGLDEHENRWAAPLVSSATFLGLDPAPDGKLLPPSKDWDHPKLKIEFLGDSITEGVLVTAKRPGKDTWPWQTDALHSYACQTALTLGAAWRQVGFGATGLSHGGSGKAVGALDSFNEFYAGCPRDDWQPDLVVINQGTNDSAMKPEDYLPLYEKYLAMVRKAYPKAKIVALQPFDQSQATSIPKAVESLRAAGDTAIYYMPTQGWFVPHAHPDAKASVVITAKLVEALKAKNLVK